MLEIRCDPTDDNARPGPNQANHPYCNSYQLEETFIPDPMDNGKLSEEEKELVERISDEAHQDRSKAVELKRELDRLGVFREYEDRFLVCLKPIDVAS